MLTPPIFIRHSIWSIAAQASVQPVLVNLKRARVVRKGPWCSVVNHGSIWKSALMLQYIRSRLLSGLGVMRAVSAAVARAAQPTPGSK